MLKLVLFFMIFLPFHLLSQTVNKRIEGIVVNPKLEIIPNVTIKIVTSDSNGLVKKFTFSNEAGKFSITVPIVSYPLFLQISVVGYAIFLIKQHLLKVILDLHKLM